MGKNTGKYPDARKNELATQIADILDPEHPIDLRPFMEEELDMADDQLRGELEAIFKEVSPNP